MIDRRAGPREYLTFLAQVAPHLDAQFVREAADFQQGQWELPFEATLLELIKVRTNEVSIDLHLVKRLAQEADLMEEGVLDPDTWRRFLHYFKGRH